MDATNSDSTTLRVRIAEAQGWKRVPNRWAVVQMWKKDGLETSTLPNWPEDLNACAQFEAGLTYHQKLIYCDELSKACQHGDIESWHFGVLTATARQRCLTYLATINPEEGK